MQNLPLTIIIPTYNRADILGRCLEQLANQTFQDFQLIIVDDGSKDNTREIAKSWKMRFENFKYIHQENQGQGNARNNALKHSLGDVVMFIGDDILLDKNAVAEHMKTHKQNPEIKAAVLGLILWHPELEVTEFMQWLTTGKEGGAQFAYDLLEGKEIADYNFFYTSNISIKKKLLDKHKFDPDFHSYGWEDIELGYKLQKEEGMVLHYNKSAVGYHHHEIDEKSLANRMRSIGRSSKIFHSKHPELKKTPPLWKKTALWLISRRPVLWIAKKYKKSFYYYALSKRYLLQGLRQV